MPKVTAPLRRLAPFLFALALASLSCPVYAQNGIVSTGNNTIVGFNLATGANFATFSNSLQLNLPGSLVFSPDGSTLYAVNQGTGSILSFNAQTGAFESTFIPAGSGGLNTPGSLFFAPNGNLFVTDIVNNSILQFVAQTGAPLGNFVNAGVGGLLDPASAAFGPNGNLFVVSRGTNNVLQFNGTTGALINEFVAPDAGGLTDASLLAFGPNGNLFVFDNNDRSVLQFNGTTGAFINVFAPSGTAGLTVATMMAFGPNGNLFILDPAGNFVAQLNGQTGAFIGNQDLPAGAGTGASFAFVPQGGGGGGTRFIILNGFYAGAQVTTDDDGTTVSGLLNQQTDASGTITPPAVPGGFGTFTGTFGTNQRAFTAQVIAYDDAPNVVQALSDAVMSNLTALVAYQGRLDPATPFIQRLPAVQTNITQTITALQLAASLTRNGFQRTLILGAVQRINQINRLITSGLANGRPNTNLIGQLVVLTQLNTQQAFRLAARQLLGVR